MENKCIFKGLSASTHSLGKFIKGLNTPLRILILCNSHAGGKPQMMTKIIVSVYTELAIFGCPGLQQEGDKKCNNLEFICYQLEM